MNIDYSDWMCIKIKGKRRINIKSILKNITKSLDFYIEYLDPYYLKELSNFSKKDVKVRVFYINYKGSNKKLEDIKGVEFIQEKHFF